MFNERMQRSEKMKIVNKKISIVFFLLAFCFMLTACDNKETEVGTEQTSAPVETEKPENPSDNEKREDEESANDDKEQKDTKDAKEDGKNVTIYSINDESLESEQTTVKLKGEITPVAIVDAVVAAFEEHSLEIGIDSVKQEGSNVIVSFLYDKAPLSQVGSTVEETILNSIADSLIDNLPNCNGVIFRAEGEAYESGHFAFGKDELYVKE